MRNLKLNFCKRFLCLSLYAVTLIPGKVAFGADICREGLKELQSSQGVIQDNIILYDNDLYHKVFQKIEL